MNRHLQKALWVCSLPVRNLATRAYAAGPGLEDALDASRRTPGREHLPGLLASWIGRFSFHVPCWVGDEVDVLGALAHMRRSRHAREDLCLMRRHGMAHEIARSRKSFDRFYWNMYRPYISRVYGDRVFHISYDEMMSKRPCSELLLKIRNEPVAGMIILHEGRRPRVWSVGVKDVDRVRVKPGALKALDYLSILHLAERGYANVHMGASRPFLNDGVLRKKRWLGLSTADHSDRGFALRPTAGSRGAEVFLAGNPFLFERDGADIGTVFASEHRVPSPQQIRQWELNYAMPGLRHLVLFAAGAAPGDEAAALGRNDAGRITVPGWRIVRTFGESVPSSVGPSAVRPAWGSTGEH